MGPCTDAGYKNCCSCSGVFSQVAYRMKQPVLFGWKKLLRQDIPGAFLPICCLFLGTLCWWSAVAFLLWKCVSWGELWGSNAVLTLLTGQVHDCMIRAAQGVLPSLTGESVPVETIICKSLGCDESQNYVLKEFETLQSKVFCTCSMFITLQVCLLLLFFFLSVFWMGKQQGALESVEWTWRSLVSIPEGSPAPQIAELQWLGEIIRRWNWNQSSSYLANTCSKFGILKTSQCQLMKQFPATFLSAHR